MSLPTDWEINWDKPSGYTPVDYSRPWDAEGWGSGDVVVTAPLKMDVEQAKFDTRPIIPDKPGFVPGQKDYMYMATEKEQRRERRAQAKDLAEARGRSWRDTPLPVPVREEPKTVYPDWRDTPLPNPKKDIVLPEPDPTSDEYKRWKESVEKGGFDWTGGEGPRPGVIYSPGPKREREWGESRPGEAYIQIEGPGNPSWEKRNPREVTIQPVSRPRRRERAFNVRDTWRRPVAGRGFSTSATQPLRRRGSSMWDVFGRR